MNEVSKKSVNGGAQVSSGYIFDQMDRFAHLFTAKEAGAKRYLFTQEAYISYKKQICDWNDVELMLYAYYKYETVSQVVVRAVGKTDGAIYAEGSFCFAEKTTRIGIQKEE